MLDYLKKFNNLPKELRDKISTTPVMIAITDLEAKYQLDLAAIVMMVMVKQISFQNLESYFINQRLLVAKAARELTDEMMGRVFNGVSEYLGIKKDDKIKPPTLSEAKKDSGDNYNLDDLIKEAGLTFSGDALNFRFKNIILTYFKGIRTRIDTRATLAKEFSLGGVNLGTAEIDRVFRISDQRLKEHNFLLITPPKPLKQLDKIILQSEHIGEEYDLKKSLAAKKTEDRLISPAAADLKHKLAATQSFLDTSHELKAPQELEEIAAPRVNLAISQPLIKKQAASDHEKNGQEKLASSPASIINNRPLPPSPVYSANKPAQVNNPSTVKNPITPIIPKISITPIIPTPSVISKTPAAPVTPVTPVTPVMPVIPKTPPVTPAIPKTPAVPVAQKKSPAAVRTTTVPGSGFGMHDIKPMPKVMGPLEELRFLDLVNFRRLGKTPEESILKILSKIKLLEKDGYDRLVAGVKAWRQSPVNRLYLRLGQEAVIKGKSFKEIVEAHLQTNSDNLNMKEIEAIVSLNSKLIF